MMTSTLSIARNTFIESIRQPIYMVMLGLVIFALVVSLFLSAYAFDNDDKILVEFGLSMIFVGGLVLASLIATGVLAREIDNKTVLTVVSKPVGRPRFILGKYLGVVAAVAIAFWVWSIVFLMLLRHQVMSTASDNVDMPVFLFGFGSAAVAILIAVWGNYFYNWVFTSRFVGLFAVLITIAYLLVLVINKKWEFQSILTEFGRTKEVEEGRAVLSQVLVALLLVFEGLMILCAVAIACSTRLGQVMTLLICAGVYLVGICSDFMFGRFLNIAPPAGYLARAGYYLTPNAGYLFVADALSQGSPVAAGYVGLVSAYAMLFTFGILCLAVAMFQTRERG